MEVASDYEHVGGSMEGFGGQVQEMYEDENAPTDPVIVFKIFDDLINIPNRTCTLRTIAGLNFGYHALTDDVELFLKPD